MTDAALIAASIIFASGIVAWALTRKELSIMAEFSRLNAAVEAVAAGILSVAEAIRNPATDNNDQAQVDELAGKLETAAATLNALKVEEDAEDAGPAPAPEPTPEPVPEEPPVE